MPDFPLPPIHSLSWYFGNEAGDASVTAPAAPRLNVAENGDGAHAAHRNGALEDYAAIQRHLITDGGERLQSREWQDSDHDASVWPHGQLAAAALDRALLTGDVDEARKALKGLERFERSDGSYDPISDHQVNPFFQHGRLYDDNAWIGLDFAQAYRLTGDQQYIDKARKVFDFLMTGQQENGGLHWKEHQDPPMFAAASNGPALQLALQLHDLTKDQKYLDKAKQIEGYMTANLRREDGLVRDDVSESGTRNDLVFSYNQGTVIGADVQLWRATGEQRYLDRAKDTAAKALDYLGRDDNLWHQSASFNAIFFRNLMQLDQVAPDPRYRTTLEDYLSRAWHTARDDKGMYKLSGIGLYDQEHATGGTLIDQSAFVEMRSLLAMTPEQLKTVA